MDLIKSFQKFLDKIRLNFIIFIGIEV